MPKKVDPLSATLNELHTQLKRQNSLGFTFLQGLMRGISTALGATLFVAIATSLTIHFADSEFMSALTRSVITAFGS